MKTIQTTLGDFRKFVEIAQIYREYIEIVPKDGTVSIRMSELLYNELRKGKIL